MANLEKIDIVKLWVLTKVNMGKSRGLYRLADGSVAKIKGVTLPQLTWEDTRQIKSFWVDFGQKLSAHLGQTGRNDLSVQLLDKLIQFQFDYGTWRDDTRYKYSEGGRQQLYQGKYLFMPAVYDFDKVVTNFVTWLSTIQWSIENVETMYERALNSIDNPIARAAFAGAVKTVEFGMELPENLKNIGGGIQRGFLFTRDILKWGAIGGGLLMLYWYVLRPSGDQKKLRG